MLDDQQALLDAIEEMAIAAIQVPAILHTENSWSVRLRSETERGAALTGLVERVEFGSATEPPRSSVVIPSTPQSQERLSPRHHRHPQG
jgi:hypothetical protein